MKHLFTMLLTSAMLALAAPAFAAPHGDDHGSHEEKGHGADDGHGHGGHDDGHGSAHGDDHHGDDHGGGHHVLWSADADGDGQPNWMDPDFEPEPGKGPQGSFATPLAKVGFHAINLLLFVGVLFWFGRRPITDALANRALGIRKELEDSHKVFDDAKARNDELGARLDKIEAEIAGMRTEAEQEAERQEQKLVERAHNEAGRIAEAAQRSIRDEVQRARFALKRDAVALAVELAESTLKEKMTADHHQQLAREFLDSLKEDKHV